MKRKLESNSNKVERWLLQQGVLKSENLMETARRVLPEVIRWIPKACITHNTHTGAQDKQDAWHKSPVEHRGLRRRLKVATMTSRLLTRDAKEKEEGKKRCYDNTPTATLTACAIHFRDSDTLCTLSILMRRTVCTASKRDSSGENTYSSLHSLFLLCNTILSASRLQLLVVQHVEPSAMH